MHLSSEYPGPCPDDYRNVTALNTAFIDASFEMKGPQKGRLAAVPFLLFSMRETDLDWWVEALADFRQTDLLARSAPISAKLRDLQCSSISFLWHLARRNPYAVRIISGASIAWCEKLAELPLVTVIERVGARSDLLASRLGNPDNVSEKLLGNGASSSSMVRHSAHIVALQSLLTRSRCEQHHHLSAAACKLPVPRRKSARRTTDRVRGKKV